MVDKDKVHGIKGRPCSAGGSDPAGPAQAEAQPPLEMAPCGVAMRRIPREAPSADVDIEVNS